MRALHLDTLACHSPNTSLLPACRPARTPLHVPCAAERTLPLCEMLAHVAAGDTSLYVFEAKLEERLPGLLDDFAVPRGYFDDDVLSVFVDLDPTSPPPPPPPVSSLPLHTPSPGSVATAPGRDTSAAPGAEAGLTPGPPTSAAAATAAAASNVDDGGHRGEGAPAAIDGVVSLGSEVLGSGSEKEGGEGGGGDEDDEDAEHGDEEDYGPPDRKWFLLGCRGSGSEVHQDPPHMSSWNVVLTWALINFSDLGPFLACFSALRRTPHAV